MDTQLTWDIINEQIENSKIQRTRWSDIFGMSLTKVITKFKLAKVSPGLTYDLICDKFSQLTLEQKRKLKISIAARYGEQLSVDKLIRR